MTQGIYTHRGAYNLPGIMPYPGIAPCVGFYDAGRRRFLCNNEEQEKFKIYHIWYQWVPFYYLGVGIVYYMPYLILKMTRLRRIKPLLMQLNDENNIEMPPKMLVDTVSGWLYNELVYPRSAPISLPYKIYHECGLAIAVLTVKLLYLLTAIGHFIGTARMFNIGNWYLYGLEFRTIRQDNSHMTPARDLLFPKMTACRFVKWGATGQEPTTGLCALTLNVMNQYLFLVLWYLNVSLIVLDVLALIYATLNILNPRIMHHSIVTSTLMQDTAEFTRFFNYIGPTGRIAVSKISENTQGDILSMIAARVMRKLDKHERKGGERKCEGVEVGETLVEEEEYPDCFSPDKQHLMEEAARALEMLPEWMPGTSPRFSHGLRNRSQTSVSYG